jgi:hypothetical protein
VIVTGGTVFIRQCDQLPQVTLRGARVVMEVSEPACMHDYANFLAHRIPQGSEITGCTFFTLEAWAQQEARERLAMAQAEARNDATPGWARRIWTRIAGKAST